MRLTDEGQVTLPRQVIEALQLKAGDEVSFDIDEAGRVTLTRQTAVERFDKALRAIKENPPFTGYTSDEVMEMTRGTDR